VDQAADRAEDPESDRAAVDLDPAVVAQDQAEGPMAADFQQREAESFQLVTRRRHPSRNRPRGPERAAKELRGEVVSVR
jgi:hypothetical protein